MKGGCSSGFGYIFRIPSPRHASIVLCAKTMASRKFFTSVVLFILMLIFASKAESSGVTETSKLGVTSKSALILGFYILFV